MPYTRTQQVTGPAIPTSAISQPVYITCANLQAVVRKSELDLNPNGEVWKQKILFFNRLEESELIAIHDLLSDPERYFSEIYKPATRGDSFRYVTPERAPAYHFSCNCSHLHSDFENYKIPVEIRRRGHDEIQRFRAWFQTNAHLLEGREDMFLFRLRNEFRISDVPKYVKYENSGYQEHENLKLHELETRIDASIKAAGRYYYACAKNTAILRVYSQRAYLGFKDEELPSQIPGYEEEEVKEFLKDYDDRFKKPLKHDLIEYYRRDLNPDIRMSAPILDELGFKPCSACSGSRTFRG